MFSVEIGRHRQTIMELSSVLDWHCVDADPEPNFYFDADPIPDQHWHQNDADPHAYPGPKFYTCWKI
jgi:hypothetical protein